MHQVRFQTQRAILAAIAVTEKAFDIATIRGRAQGVKARLDKLAPAIWTAKVIHLEYRETFYCRHYHILLDKLRRYIRCVHIVWPISKVSRALSISGVGQVCISARGL